MDCADPTVPLVSSLFEIESADEKARPSACCRPNVDGHDCGGPCQWDVGCAVVRVILDKMPANGLALKLGTSIDECPSPGSATDRPSSKGSAGRHGKQGHRRHRKRPARSMT